MSSSSQDVRASSTSRKIEHAAEAVDDMKNRIKDRAQELVEGGQEAVENAGNRMREHVNARPLTAVLLAGGVGLLLGMLIARKR